MPDLTPILHRPRILLVEDHPLNRELFCDLLEVCGYHITAADRAEEGIKIAHEQPFALILMDLSLPGMNGMDAIRLLKADQQTRCIPIVALTSHAMPEHQRAALAAGCAGFISKPIDTREFPQQIAGLLLHHPGNLVHSPVSNPVF